MERTRSECVESGGEAARWAIRKPARTSFTDEEGRARTKDMQTDRDGTAGCAPKKLDSESAVNVAFNEFYSLITGRS